MGGLNPNAVEQVATFAGGFGRVVYMPTFESEHYNPGSKIAVPISKNGELLPAVHEVLAVMAKYDMSLSTGHSSPQESLMLIKAAKEKGVTKIYVQHPMLEKVGMPIETQKEAAKMGALLEYVIGEALGGPRTSTIGPKASVRSVRRTWSIRTDLGQQGRPIHADGYKAVLPRLRKFGFTQAEIDVMTKTNPARFLGLGEMVAGGAQVPRRRVVPE